MIVVALVLLGALAWSVGWVAHSLVSPSRPSPTATATPPALPTSSPTVAPMPTVEPTQTPPESVTSTAAPTSTPAPSATPTEQYRTYFVQQDQTLAQIAGIVCPNLFSYQKREAFAYQIQQWNPNKIRSIHDIQPGAELVIPPCPP
jgi:Tfp pilus assembly protein FimV